MLDKSISLSAKVLNRVITSPPKTISSDVLLGKEKSIFILHEGHQYQLRITKLKKLILTK